MANLSDPGHLPNLRVGGEAAKPDWLPRQREGITPQMVGRYPDYDVLASTSDWDEATRKVVLERLNPPETLRFFSVEQAPTLRAFCDVLLAQDTEPRVPVVELVDAKLAAGRLDGYEYDDMPDDRETWRLVLDGLDVTAQQWHGKASFADCAEKDQEGIVKTFAAGQLAGEAWKEVNVSHAWEVCTRMALEAFYSHPWAWNEIGFGGPAYPQGYMRLGPLSILEPRERPGATDEDPVRVAPEPEG
jgi:gluconate 2-dehydrogenase subunit 3-like protein